MKIDRDKAAETFLDYASGYDMTDVKVKLKVDHTFRVADLCARIAGSIGLDGQDCDLAYLMGILHDIGRFEQLRRFHTFRDAVSVNHAMLSADLLFQEGLIERFGYAAGQNCPAHEAQDSQDAAGTAETLTKQGIVAGTAETLTEQDADEMRLIEKAIRLHNAYLLPEDLTAREKTFCQVLRDADKVDILRVNRETPMTQIYDLPEEAFLTAEISDPVYEDLLSRRNVNRANSRTAADFLMGHIAFVYGLVYPESFRLVKEQGYLEQMLQFESRNEKTRKRLLRVRDEIHAYLDEKVR